MGVAAPVVVGALETGALETGAPESGTPESDVPGSRAPESGAVVGDPLGCARPGPVGAERGLGATGDPADASGILGVGRPVRGETVVGGAGGDTVLLARIRLVGTGTVGGATVGVVTGGVDLVAVDLIAVDLVGVDRARVDLVVDGVAAGVVGVGTVGVGVLVPGRPDAGAPAEGPTEGSSSSSNVAHAGFSCGRPVIPARSSSPLVASSAISWRMRNEVRTAWPANETARVGSSWGSLPTRSMEVPSRPAKSRIPKGSVMAMSPACPIVGTEGSPGPRWRGSSAGPGRRPAGNGGPGRSTRLRWIP